MTQSSPVQIPQSSLPENPDTLQRRASHPGMSVWVGASAGSGKTKVLADRVLRLLLAGTKPEKLLCLTFTRAAAAQMSLRLTSRLSRWATCDDKTLYEDLDKLIGSAPPSDALERARRLFAETLNCPGGIRLRTIHAFCQEILKRFPLEANLPPQFTVLEESESTKLLQDSFRDLLHEAIQDPESAIGKSLALFIAQKSEDTLFGLLKSAIEEPDRFQMALDQTGTLDDLFRHQRELMGLDANATQDKIILASINFIDEARLRQASQWMSEGAKSFAERATNILSFLSLSQQERQENFFFYTRQFLTADQKPYARLAGADQIKKYETLGPLLADEAMRLQKTIEHIATLRLAEQGQALFTLAARLLDLYQSRKRNRAALDYDDLIRFAGHLLHRDGIAPWILFKLDGGIDHILVDEAQDTSLSQWDMVAVLAEEFFSGQGASTQTDRTLFVVGDEKQSIYSFRKADPEAFARMQTYFKSKIEAAKPGFYTEVPLNTSFRSAPAVLQAVDTVFANDQTKRGVSVPPVLHHAWRRHATGRVEVWEAFAPASKNKDDKQDDNWTPPLAYDQVEDPAAFLAQKIATRIAHDLQNDVLIDNRPLRAGDIMILVQRRTVFVDHLVKALKKNNVPVSGVDRMVLTSQLAVVDLINLLQFILLPQDDLTLACILRGPLAGVSENDLMNLAMGRPASLWHQLGQTPSLKSVHDYLAHWLDRADKVSPFALLAEILHTPCPADTISGKKALWKRLGAEALDPIDEFLSLAQNVAARGTLSLQSFVQDLLQSESEIKRELDQAGDAVRITTVHASKGLEAPIVILPDTTYLPGTDKLPKILWLDEEPVPFYIPSASANPLLTRLRDQARTKQLEEHRRLLYVALTRAADHLYIAAYRNKRSDATGQNWYDLTISALKELDNPSAHKDDEVIAFEDPLHQPQDLRPTEAAQPSASGAPAPDWLFKDAPQEQMPPRPLMPSREDEVEPATLSPNDARFARGRIIHRLLQSLPDLDAALRQSAAQHFLAQTASDLSGAEKDDILHEVLRLFDDPSFTPLFTSPARAEVPLVGRVGSRLISGQIDRLCFVGDELWLIDYKTNRPPPETDAGIPPLYRRQLAAYAALLKRLYPTLELRCFLFWTHAPRLMEVMVNDKDLPPS